MLKRFNKKLILVGLTVLITIVLVNTFKKPELQLSYPPVAQLPSDFRSLTCEQVSETYMRAWSEGSDLPHKSSARVQLALHEEKARKWQSSYKDQNGNRVDNSKIKKATIRLEFKDNKMIFSGDNLWNLENQPLDVTLNNPHRLAGAIITSKEEAPRYDIAGTFMLDRKTSLLLLSDTDTMITQNESLGSRSRLFACKQSS